MINVPAAYYLTSSRNQKHVLSSTPYHNAQHDKHFHRHKSNTSLTLGLVFFFLFIVIILVVYALYATPGKRRV